MCETWRRRLTESLLAQGDALQLVQAKLLAGTVDDCVLENLALNAVQLDRGGIVALELPCILALVVDQTRRVVALVQVLKDGGQDLGVLLGKSETLAGGFHVLLPQDGTEERRLGEDILVSREYPLLRADDESDDG